MLRQRFTFHIVEDDAVAQPFKWREFDGLTDELVLQHAGGLVLLAQGSATFGILGKGGLQGLDDHLLSVVFGRENPPVSIPRSIERLDL